MNTIQVLEQLGANANAKLSTTQLNSTLDEIQEQNQKKWCLLVLPNADGLELDTEALPCVDKKPH